MFESGGNQAIHYCMLHITTDQPVDAVGRTQQNCLTLVCQPWSVLEKGIFLESSHQVKLPNGRVKDLVAK